MGTVAFLLVVFFLWWLVNPSTPEQRTAFIQTIGTIVGGSALLFGLYFTARNLQVSREGQITERFTQAIDQLGATDDKTGEPTVEIRLGGIYALERIARDSNKDFSQIMDVLTAYIRKNAAWPPEATASNDDTKQPDVVLFPAADIQAILTVIGRRAHYFDVTREVDFADLHVRLGSAFAHGDVRYINLFRTDLRGANLSEGHLEGAILYEAHLEGAVLYGTHLEGANLYGAHLEGASLIGVEELSQEQIEQATGDKKTTQLPDHLALPTHWDVNSAEQPESD
jgi:hypothetical protein